VWFQVPPPEKTAFNQYGSAVVSPDGRRLAFGAVGSDGKELLWVRALDALTAQILPGTDGARYSFWSPDSRFLGFFAQGKLKKVDASGGPPQTLADVVNPVGGAWSRDGIILFAPDFFTGLWKVAAAGGPPTPLTTPDQTRQETSHRWPQFLPDGRRFLYFVRGEQEQSGMYAGSLDSKDGRRILATDWNALYAPSARAGPGHLFFLRQGTLMTQPFDPDRLQLTGEPAAIAEGVGASLGRGHFSVSDTGVLAYGSGAGQSSQIQWFARTGKPLEVVGPPGQYAEVSLSPDQTQAAVSLPDDRPTALRDIWLLELARGIRTRFTFHPRAEYGAVWSPDGSRIAFTSFRDGPANLYLKALSGSAEEPLLRSSALKVPNDWSSDGRYLVYTQADPNTKRDLWVLPMSGERKPAPWLQTAFDETQAQFSPGAPRWIAYVSNESGQPEVYVQPFPGPGRKWQISTGGGRQPRWRRDGKELFYLAPDRKLMAVAVSAGESLDPQAPVLLFETRVLSNLSAGDLYFQYAPAADGRRFLVNTAVAETAAPPVTVVLNWIVGRLP